MQQSAGVAIATVLSVLAIVDIVGNFLVCMVIKRNREMRSAQYDSIILKVSISSPYILVQRSIIVINTLTQDTTRAQIGQSGQKKKKKKTWVIVPVN